MLYISPYEILVVVAVFAAITFGPPLAAWGIVMVQRWKERKRKS